MLFKDFDSLFKKQALSVSFDQGLDLALVVCKRLYFDYEAFVSEEKWGDKDILMDAIRFCEEFRGKKVEQNIYSDLLAAVDQITPDMDDFGNHSGSYALNAAASVYETIQFLSDEDNIHIYNVGICLTDTVDFKIAEEMQETVEPTEEMIDEHPMMKEARTLLLNLTK